MSDITRDYSFGGWLRSLRIKQGLTLRDMCKQNGFDVGNYSKLERSEINPPKSKRLILEITKPITLTNVELDLLLSAAFNFHVGQLRKRFQ